jgi:hypothetical protein
MINLLKIIATIVVGWTIMKQIGKILLWLTMILFLFGAMACAVTVENTHTTKVKIERINKKNLIKNEKSEKMVRTNEKNRYVCKKNIHDN